MKLRPAAALSLVAWYLIVPPVSRRLPDGNDPNCRFTVGQVRAVAPPGARLSHPSIGHREIGTRDQRSAGTGNERARPPKRSEACAMNQLYLEVAGEASGAASGEASGEALRARPAAREASLLVILSLFPGDVFS
jgi:hypothetical protein